MRQCALPVAWPPPVGWTVELKRLGFAPEPASCAWRHNGTVFLPDAAWSRLETVCQPRWPARLRAPFSAPGFWRWIGDGRYARCVFELPNRLLTDAEEDAAAPEAGSGVFASCVEWGLATAGGRAPAGWCPPPQADLDRLLPPQARLIQSGSVVRSGAWLAEPNALALQVVILPRVREDLSAARRRWLDAVLCRAADHWRLVRVGYQDGERGVAVVGEVNFTGAPVPVMQRMISVSWACLCGLTTWLSEPVSLLGECSLDLEALEFAAKQTTVNEEEKP